MHELTRLIRDDMTPALGVTEPGAIAFSVAKARSYTSGAVKRIHVAMNSGMYKNAYSCGIPHSSQVGSLYAAALGYVGGNPDKGLESLSDVTPEHNLQAQALIEQGLVQVEMSGVTSRIMIRATVETEADTAVVTIRHAHTRIVSIEVNGRMVMQDESAQAAAGEDSAPETPLIHRYTLEEILDYVKTVPAEEIAFVSRAYQVNMELLQEGLQHPRTTFARTMLDMNGGQLISQDEQTTGMLLCCAAIEARVIGLDKPAMSITGSGAHGIIATMPLYGVCQIRGISDEQLHRATMLSYLICTYIKEYSGKLSAFCGCAIAAGTGMACALCYLRGGGLREITYTLQNMASSLTGMICDGGNQGCTMKGVAACDTAFRAAEFALRGVHIDHAHGVNGPTPEDTMRNIGLIASPGMVDTERVIVEILENKH